MRLRRYGYADADRDTRTDAIIEIDSPVWQSTSIEMGEAQIRRLLPALEDVAARMAAGSLARALMLS